MRVQDYLSSVKDDLSSFIRLIRPRKDLDQGGLASPVFSAQAMHLTFVQIERDVLKRQYAGKGLRYISPLQDLAHGGIPVGEVRSTSFDTYDQLLCNEISQ